MKDDKGNEELRSRLLDFAVNVLKMLSNLPFKKEYDVLKYQLSKSATSIGANYEESQSSTYKEFLHKIRISLREANETKYWLAIIEQLDLVEKDKLIILLNEAKEITLILGSIASKVDKKIKEGK